LLYPLSYGGWRDCPAYNSPAGPKTQYQS
jgi:hypothetical protein